VYQKQKPTLASTLVVCTVVPLVLTLVLSMVVGFYAGIAWLLMLVWNGVMPDVTKGGLGEVTFWQSAGLMVLVFVPLWLVKRVFVYGRKR